MMMTDEKINTIDGNSKDRISVVMNVNFDTEHVFIHYRPIPRISREGVRIQRK